MMSKTLEKKLNNRMSITSLKLTYISLAIALISSFYSIYSSNQSSKQTLILKQEIKSISSRDSVTFQKFINLYIKDNNLGINNQKLILKELDLIDSTLDVLDDRIIVNQKRLNKIITSKD
jgi:hypothetical protein